jgi:sporulation-control protein spo0M
LFRLPFWFFVDAGEDLVMADDVVMPSNPLVALVENEKLEETSLDVNISQRPHDKESFERMVCTRVDRSA